MKIRAHVFVQGKVQGVYFRQNATVVAKRNGITGWIRNMIDGRVEAILEGQEVDVCTVIEWFHTGPPKAIVNEVVVKYEKYIDEFTDFKIES